MIQAWQHIYTNVEKEQSPRQLAGFQTLAYTPELGEDEVAELEGRLLYVPSQVEPVKRLFFTTAAGHAVVAQVVPLADPDQYGRKGRYLAHSLLFPAEAFQACGADPYAVLSTFPFVTTVADAIALCRGTSALPPVALQPLAPALGDNSGWSTEAMRTLALLALRAEEMAAERQALAVVGEPEEIEAALWLALLAVPTPLRTWCTFDTYFYRCNLVATYYWAVGLPERLGNANFLFVDAAARRVPDGPDDNGRTRYERWVLASIAAGTWPQDAVHRDAVFAYASWQEGHLPEGTPAPVLPPAVRDAVLACCPPPARTTPEPAVDWQMPEPKRGGLLKKFGEIFGRK